MKNKFLLVLLTFILLFVPVVSNALEMKSMKGQFSEEILSAFQNEDTGIDQNITFARYLQDEDGTMPPVLAYSMEFYNEYIPSLTNPSNGYNYVAVDNLINDDYKAGLQYIVQNGFKETSGYYVDNVTYFKNQVVNKVTNAPLNGRKWFVNYWATQIAIWWYQDEMDHTSNISNNFKTAACSTSATEIGKAICDLVTGAKEASNDKALKEINLSTSKLEMNLDGDDYKSDYITISNKDSLGDFTVRVTTGGSNYVILDESGSARNTFSPNEKFLVASRELDVKKVEDITLRIEATKSVNVGFRYVNGIDQKLIAVAPGDYTAYGTIKLHVNWIKPTRDISVAKLDSETNKLVAGATLELIDGNNNVVDEVVTTTNRVVFKDVPYGKYTLREKKAPAHYQKSTEEISILINNRTDMVIYKNIKNDPLKTIRIAKVDSEKKTRIVGAVLDIYDANKELVKEITTTNSYVDVPDLYYGVYTIVEKSAPAGYSKSDIERKVTIDKRSPLVIDVEYSNDPLKSVSIAAISRDDNSIFAGAKMTLRDASGNLVSEFTSDSVRTVINNLPYGTYTIGETEAPTGYKKIEQPVTFTIDASSNDTILVDIPHTPYYTVKVYKLDGTTMQPIAGAELEILNSSGEVVKKFTSTDDYVLIDDLDKGTYTIRETKAPKGFALSTTSETFEIVDNQVMSVNFINSEIFVPSTDKNNKGLIISLIIGLVGFGFVFLSMKRYS